MQHQNTKIYMQAYKKFNNSYLCIQLNANKLDKGVLPLGGGESEEDAVWPGAHDTIETVEEAGGHEEGAAALLHVHSGPLLVLGNHQRLQEKGHKSD